MVGGEQLVTLNMKEGWLVVSGSVTLKYEGRVVGGEWSSHTEI